MAVAPTKNNFKANPAPIDPDVKVPDAVRRATEAANAAMAANAPPNPDAPPAPPSDTITIVEASPPQKLPEQVTTVVPAPAQPTNPTVPTNNDAPVAPPNDKSWMENYNAQVGRVRALTKLNEDLQGRVQALEHLLATPQMSAQPQPTLAPAPAAAKLISPKEEEDFGPEMIDIMRRAAREVASPEVETLRAQIAALEGKLNGTVQTVATDARGRMLQALDSQLPDWHQINHDPEFHAWLALPDPFSGVMRKSLLGNAYEQNKTSQVLAFFKSFVSEMAATAPAVAPTAPTPALPQPSKPSLESLAAPGRARASASPQLPAEKQIIYTSDINAFYDAKRKGLYNGREEEFAAAERELQAAMREGRVVTNT